MHFDQLQAIAANLLRQDATTRYDAGETMVFTRQLENIRAKLYEIKYGENVLRSVLPSSTESYSNTDERFTYRQYAIAGEARELNLYGSDEFPMVELQGAEFTKKFMAIGAGYQYSVQEMRAAAKLGVALDALKGSAAKRVIDNKIDLAMAVGSDSSALNGITGMFNAPNVTAGTLAAAGLWSAKAVEAIGDDVAKLRSDIRLATLGNYNANVLLLAQSAYETLTRKRTVTTTGAVGPTALQYLQEQMPDLKITYSSRLDSASVTTAPGFISGVTGMLFPYDPEVIYSVMSQEFEQFAPQMEGMRMVTMCHARSGGAVIRVPSACSYLIV